MKKRPCNKKVTKKVTKIFVRNRNRFKSMASRLTNDIRGISVDSVPENQNSIPIDNHVQTQIQNSPVPENRNWTPIDNHVQTQIQNSLVDSVPKNQNSTPIDNHVQTQIQNSFVDSVPKNQNSTPIDNLVLTQIQNSFVDSVPKNQNSTPVDNHVQTQIQNLPVDSVSKNHSGPVEPNNHQNFTALIEPKNHQNSTVGSVSLSSMDIDSKKSNSLVPMDIDSVRDSKESPKGSLVVESALSTPKIHVSLPSDKEKTQDSLAGDSQLSPSSFAGELKFWTDFLNSNSGSDAVTSVDASFIQFFIKLKGHKKFFAKFLKTCKNVKISSLKEYEQIRSSVNPKVFFDLSGIDDEEERLRVELCLMHEARNVRRRSPTP